VTTLETLAHELRQPLGAILSNAQAAQRLLLTGSERSAVEVREILEDIVACDKRAAGILRCLEEALRSGTTVPDSHAGEPAGAQPLRQAQGDGE
jgi:signal transduction histidine kinase